MLKTFGNRVLKVIFEPNKDDVMGAWRKLDDKE
jgi:hypothetical protein